MTKFAFCKNLSVEVTLETLFGGRMKKFEKGLMIIAVVTVLAILFVSCKEVTITSNTYDPSFLLSGNVEKVVKYMPVSELGLETERLELSEVIESITPLGKIEKLLVLTHGSKSIVINSASIPFYYLTVNSQGIARLYTTIESHNQMGVFPILSLSEIVVISADGCGIKCVYDDKSITVNYLTFLKSRGMLVSGGDAIEDDNLELSVFSYRNIDVKKLLGSNESICLRFDDGSSLEVDANSTGLLNWSNGGLRIVGGSESEAPKAHIVAIDFRNVKEE